MYGGGIAILACVNCEFHEPVILQNSVAMPQGQGAGLFMANTSITSDSTWLATANFAEGAFMNVLWEDELLRTVAERANGTVLTIPTLKSCYQCSPCQEKWCEFIGKCEPETCEFVTVGDAYFEGGSPAGMRRIFVDFDVPYSVGQTAGGVVPCEAVFSAASAAALGKGAVCSVRSATGGRRLAQQNQQLVINLGEGFTVVSATSLEINTAGLSAPYSGMSNLAIVQLAQSGQTPAQLQQLQRIAISYAQDPGLAVPKSAVKPAPAGQSIFGLGAAVLCALLAFLFARRQ
eukprot:tig00020562_g11142.t1